MIGYNDLYEILRKEKYSEPLQPLPKKFIEEFKEYLKEKKEESPSENSLFSDTLAKSKKQFENAISIFKEIIIKRKKKILSLVFVATETGMMKKDYENMLEIEKEIFDTLIKAFEKGDKEIFRILSGESEKKEENKIILFRQDTEKFINHEGKSIGPFKSGDLANIGAQIADILVSGGKANFVDGN